MSASIKRFLVTSMVENFGDHKNVELVWFVIDRPNGSRHSYREVIVDYDQLDDESRRLTEGYFNELFREDEADELVAFLADRYGTTSKDTTIRAIDLPIQSNVMPFGALPCGGGVNILEIYADDGYPLPFKVGGYHDLRFCEYAPKPVETNLDIPF